MQVFIAAFYISRISQEGDDRIVFENQRQNLLKKKVWRTRSPRTVKKNLIKIKTAKKK